MGLWIVAAIFTPFYFLDLRDHVDPLFHICTRLAWTIPLWSLGCFAIWVIVGGWGPPCCEGFLILGVGHGILAGLFGYIDRTSPTPPGEGGEVIDPPVR